MVSERIKPNLVGVRVLDSDRHREPNQYGNFSSSSAVTRHGPSLRPQRPKVRVLPHLVPSPEVRPPPDLRPRPRQSRRYDVFVFVVSFFYGCRRTLSALTCEVTTGGFYGEDEVSNVEGTVRLRTRMGCGVSTSLMILILNRRTNGTTESETRHRNEGRRSLPRSNYVGLHIGMG